MNKAETIAALRRQLDGWPKRDVADLKLLANLADAAFFRRTARLLRAQVGEPVGCERRPGFAGGLDPRGDVL
jgi:hypothetical protein